jgi:hypothetical protein
MGRKSYLDVRLRLTPILGLWCILSPFVCARYRLNLDSVVRSWTPAGSPVDRMLTGLCNHLRSRLIDPVGFLHFRFH